MKQRICWTSVALTLFATQVRAGTDWYVDDDGQPGGTGTIADPYPSIGAALGSATTLTGDRVLVMPGLYVEQVDFAGKGLRLVALDGPTVTTIDGGGSGSVLTLLEPDGACSIEGFTIDGAGSDVAGGAVRVERGELQLRDCRLTGNGDDVGPLGGGLFALDANVLVQGSAFADFHSGGALHAVDSRITLLASAFDGNRVGTTLTGPASGVNLDNCLSRIVDCSFAENGNNDVLIRDMGGALKIVGGELYLGASQFERNRPEFVGGGLTVEDGRATVDGCTFVDNLSADSFFGGALYVHPSWSASELVVTNSSFVGSQAGDGGAIFIGAGQAHFDGCTFSDNRTSARYTETGRGGALYAAAGSLVSVHRCVFTDNYAGGNFGIAEPAGGAIFGAVDVTHSSFLRNYAGGAGFQGEGGAAHGAHLVHCIAWDCGPTPLDAGAQAEWSDVEGGFAGVGNLDVDPLFWNPDAPDLHLNPASPCIDAGDPDGELDVDGSRPDQGAFPAVEPHHPEPATYCVASPNSAGCSAAIAWSGTPQLGGPDDFHVRAEAVLNRTYGFLLYGMHHDYRTFAGGVLCIYPPIARPGLLQSGGTQGDPDCSGSFDVHLAHGFLSNTIETVGVPLYVQFWYRDTGLASGVAFSDALVFTLTPP